MMQKSKNMTSEDFSLRLYKIQDAIQEMTYNIEGYDLEGPKSYI